MAIKVYKPICKHCRHWQVIVEDKGNSGYCHRYAPRPVVDRGSDRDEAGDLGEVDPWTNWPRTHDTNSCGEYEASDEVIDAKADDAAEEAYGKSPF